MHDPGVLDAVVRQEREIRSVAFHTLEEVRELCADFTARRVEAALAALHAAGSGTPGGDAGPAAYTESGRSPTGPVVGS